VRDRVTATGIARATQVERGAAPRRRSRLRHNRNRWMADATDVSASADEDRDEVVTRATV
jgi:hypothetical protein